MTLLYIFDKLSAMSDNKSKTEYANELYSQKKYNEAISIYQELIPITDDSQWYEKCELYRMLGNAYYALQDFDNAIIAYEHTLNYSTTNDSIYNILGYLYYYKDIDKAIYYYLKGMEIKPNLKNFVMLTQIMIKNKNYSQKELKKIFEKYVDYFRPQILGENKAFTYEKPYNHDKLRIGYLSSDVHCHTMMSFCLPIFENHNQEKFDIYIYACGQKNDSVTKRIIETGIKYNDCKDLNEYELATKIHDDEIDILIDLSGYTHNQIWSLLFKPAPIIGQYLGFLGTYGMKEIDFIIADEFTIPQDIAQDYTEKPLYINSGMNRFTFNTKNQKLPEITPLPCLTNNYITFGSFNCMSKLNPYTIDLWSKVLHAVPTSRLLIYRTTLQERDIIRFKKQFTQNNIDESRVIFENESMPINHFQSYLMADIVLDPCPFGGLSLTIEEAFMGVPTLTLVGETISAKGSGRVNKAIGLDEFVTYTEEEYVQKAVELSSDIDKLNYYRTNLREIMYSSELCSDYETYVDELENSYLKIWQDYKDANN